MLNAVKDSPMTETLSPVVVPYADFLARRERRGRVAAEIGRPVAPPPIGTDDPPLAVAVAIGPISSEPK